MEWVISMKNELKQDFTRRLSQCNRGEMIVIVYDIYFAYAQDIRDALRTSDHEAFRTAVHKAQNTLQELIRSLDFSYPLARQLYQLYVYCNNQLSRALYQRSPDGVDEAEKILKRLYHSFVEAAKKDQSGPLMRNTQQVYAGMTYGRQDLNESCIEDSSRGFFA